MRYSVEVDKASAAEALSLLEFVGGNSRDAIRIAVNKTARQARTSTKLPGGGANQRIRQQVRLTSGYVNERLSLSLASNSNMSASIKTPSRGLLLSHYATNMSNLYGKPRVKVKPDGATKVVRRHPDAKTDPFYMILKNGVIAIAARRKEPGPRGGKIKVFHSASLSQVFSSVRDELQPEVEKLLQEELLDAVDYLVRRKRPVDE